MQTYSKILLCYSACDFMYSLTCFIFVPESVRCCLLPPSKYILDVRTNGKTDTGAVCMAVCSVNFYGNYFILQFRGFCKLLSNQFCTASYCMSPQVHCHPESGTASSKKVFLA